MYDLLDYGKMLLDRGRVEAYAAALRAVVSPGCTVLEIGTGTGVFALLAAKLGAATVHAVETDDVVQVARDTAAANGLADRIVFHQARSQDVTLDRPADVLLSDLRGVVPFFQTNVQTVADARRRLLAPGARVVARRDVVRAAVVESAESYRRFGEAWDGEALGLDLSPVLRKATSRTVQTRARPEELLTAPADWAEIDYAAVESPDAEGELAWTAERAGTAHGFVAWFDSELAEGIRISNAPGSGHIYGTLFFPWERPVGVEAGDRVRVDLRARHVAGDYVWSWDTRVEEAGTGREKAAFRQTTAFAALPTLDGLRRSHDAYVPSPADAEVDAAVLALVDGRRSVGEIARALADRFPERFPGWREAVGQVGRLVRERGL